MDTAGLLAGLEIYAADAIRKRWSSPKFQVHNTALISARRNEFFEQITREPAQWGRIVESCIGAHLINHSLTENFKVYYLRRRNAEIDFALEKRGKVVGLEVKSSTAGNISGMAAFKNKYTPHKVLLVGNSGIPWQEFLQINSAELLS